MAGSISEIKKRLEAASIDMLPQLISEYENDERSGVQKCVESAKKRIKAFEKEKERISELWFYERKYSEFRCICGIDEAGRGPLAGPVVAGAVVLPVDCDILYINDSKKLSEKKREELYDIIYEKSISAAVGIVGPDRIDQINILQATYEAMRAAVSGLSVKPDLLLNDAVTIPEINIRQVPIIKGDARSISIGAASIIAKVTRDRIMKDLDREYPEYGFAGHKGYGSAAHIKTIEEIGPCPIHRRTFIGNFSIPDKETWKYR
ncbi:MAG: ribonuclease HII [Lachnospiraceae bacterium]|nr:ribonuclease HII [Lachnospiraceae bacterium]